MDSVGFIGLGKIGSFMCKRLLQTGVPAVVHDMRQEAMLSLQRSGAKVAANPRSVADATDMVLLSLPSDKQVEEVIFGKDGLIHSERASKDSRFIIIDLSTSNPRRTREMSERLQDMGVELIDAPVSGGLKGALTGELTIMVGGTESNFLRCHSMLSRLGKHIIHVGDVGSGHTAKVINNLVTAINLASTAEAMAIGMRSGIEPARLLEVINHSSGRSAVSELKFPQILRGDTTVGFTVQLMNKDMDIALELAKELGMPTFISSTARQIWTKAAEDWADKDFTQIVKAIERLMGVQFSESRDE